MIAHAMSIRKNIRVVSVRSGYSSNYTYETEKTSLAYGGPHKLTCQLSCKAGGLQKRRALKCYWHSEFHHIIERPFPFKRQISLVGNLLFSYYQKFILLINLENTFFTLVLNLHQTCHILYFYLHFTPKLHFKRKKVKKWGPENERVTKKVIFYLKIIAEKFGGTEKK